MTDPSSPCSRCRLSFGPEELPWSVGLWQDRDRRRLGLPLPVVLCGGCGLWLYPRLVVAVEGLMREP